MIRGFVVNCFLIVVDGIRMNNVIFRSGNLYNVISIDAHSLENIEIIFGPGSVLYGSDALGGVMSFNTINPKFSSGNGINSSGKAMLRYSSANFEKTANINFSLGINKWAVLISSTYTDFDDLRMGSHGHDEYLRKEYVIHQKFNGVDNIKPNPNPEKQLFTGYSQFNMLTKFRYMLTEERELSINANYSQTSDIPRYDRLIAYKSNKLRYGDWFYGPQKWTLLSGQFKNRKKQLFYDKMSAIAGFQEYTENRHDRNLNNPTINHREENVKMVTANIDFAKTWGKRNEIFYGAEYCYNFVNSTGTSENLITGIHKTIDSRYPDNSIYKSYAVYSSYKLNLNRKFVFQSGLRFTRTISHGIFDTRLYNFPFDDFRIDNHAFNGNLGIVWNPDPTWQINLNGSTGFRAPNIDDAAKVFESTPGIIVVPNPDLEPEYARNYEIEVIKSIGGRARFEITGFHINLDNAMVRRDYTMNGKDSIMYNGIFSKVQTYTNTSWEKINKLNLSFEYMVLKLLRLKTDYTLTKGNDSDKYPARHVPPNLGSSHLIFQIHDKTEGINRFFMDVYALYSKQFSYNQLAPTEIEKTYIYTVDINGKPYCPAWWTLNVKSFYTLNKNITATLGIENLLDKRYRAYSSGITSAGINFICSIQYSF